MGETVALFSFVGFSLVSSDTCPHFIYFGSQIRERMMEIIGGIDNPTSTCRVTHNKGCASSRNTRPTPRNVSSCPSLTHNRALLESGESLSGDAVLLRLEIDAVLPPQRPPTSPPPPRPQPQSQDQDQHTPRGLLRLLYRQTPA